MRHYVPFLFAGILIGGLLTIQLRSNVTPESSYALDEYEFQKEVVQTFVDDQTELEERLTELREQVEAEEAKVSQLYSSVDSEDLQSMKEALGLTELSGSGVEIILDDSEEVDRGSLTVNSNSLVAAADLRDVINLLRTFPFEGLAINGQRIVSVTSIQSAGSTILINNFNVVPPFTIQIITDVPDLVIQKLSHEPELSSLYDRVSSQNIEFKFKEEENLKLPAYLGIYSIDFLTLADDET
ncbi:MAG: DUF881 domain-containing protein [Candidatus Peregrinibacteria bacterium]|nr:DUF881 domain-containing protein [Candidatus Peregrinibacteria bacterium]